MVTEDEFVNAEIDRLTAGVITLGQEELAWMKDRARAKFLIYETRKGEVVEARGFYEMFSTIGLDEIRKVPVKRKVLTVTIPERMSRRIEGVEKGKRSAYVSRLLARGWLSQMGVDE